MRSSMTPPSWGLNAVLSSSVPGAECSQLPSNPFISPPIQETSPPCAPYFYNVENTMSHAPLPRLPVALLRRLLPRAERDELLVDVRMEYEAIAAAEGIATARRWLWRQALGSAPALLGWNWWRGWTGFEPRANAYRPGGSMLR